MQDALPLKMLQISDTHLFADPEQSLLGVNTQKSLEAILDVIKQNERPFDFLLHSGDLTQDCSKAAYLRLADMLSTFKVPVLSVPGNHDDPKIMASVYPHGMMANEKQILTKNWQIILLDSHKADSVEGYLPQSELDFLEHCLQTEPHHFSVVVFHHQPFTIHCAWLDKLALQNSNKVLETIYRYKNLKLVLFGHIHQQYETKQHDIGFYATPSTCIQFMRHQDHFGLENLPQGYRRVLLYPDGRFDTSVMRLKNYIGFYDAEAKGY